ncbi:MAG: folylpolyglutamate synthase/dihydrofolate synthase family protein [bacterium]
MKFGLEGIQDLLSVLGHPHLNFPTIHVAGTNGKGSTAAMLAAIFTAAGYKTGLYTSPHLVDITERIRINGKPINKNSLSFITKILEKELQERHSTFFEAITAIAFSYFSQEDVDIAIIETGLGGRLDSTNVIHPLVSIITNISLEHTEVLGATLRKITSEKAGIIKKDTPCITGVSDPQCIEILREVCKKQKSELILTDKFEVKLKDYSLFKTISTITSSEKRYRNFELRLGGLYQLQNLKLVLSAVEVLNKKSRFHISEKALRLGLKNVISFSGIQARCMLWSRRSNILLDVAHNSGAIETLVDTLKELQKVPIDVVLGVLKDKDYSSMIKKLAPIVRRAYVAPPQSERARDAADLEQVFHELQVSVRSYRSPTRAIQSVIKANEGKHTILVTGSHYLVGEIIAYLNKRA